MNAAEMVRMALAEAGYPDAEVTGSAAGPSVLLGPDGVPDKVCWQAFYVTRLADVCWPCWRDGYDCEQESCSPDCTTEFWGVSL